MKSRFYFNAWISLALSLLLVRCLSARSAEAQSELMELSPKLIVKNFVEKLKLPLVANSTPLSLMERSSDRQFGIKSAEVIADAIKKKITFKDFGYAGYSLGAPTPGSWVSLYVFETQNENEARALLHDLPDAEGGAYGLLPTKAPQRYEVRLINNMLCVLIVERWQPDELTNALFKVFRSLGGSAANEK